IARKTMRHEELELMNDELKRVFKFEEIKYCIHDDFDNCTCRKPKPGMILNLIDKYNIEKNESILIGDSWKDIEAGKNAGIKTVLLSQNYNRGIKINPDYKVTSLMDLYHLINWNDE
ncbi:MAG: HAD-IIIA family hydrolase, partial [Bacteroidota bacterium]